ncbi:MAG: hypothetical protein A3F68_10695 [Acidobacteria bacterium RIFCSPLOWO2_12_FULL_54_10]|nr:MAG: hypothetical protein A3F68_10695 [Acidobacteria bacterium RIFCSPLOWO2_12_FULL_54_10]
MDGGMITFEEFALTHSFLNRILENELKQTRIIPDNVKEILDEKRPEQIRSHVSEAAQQWLELLDLAVTPHLIRKHAKDPAVQENELRSFIRFLLTKKAHSVDDRDRVDWLATYMVRTIKERAGEPVGWPRKEISEIADGLPLLPLSGRGEEVLTELPSLLDEVKYLERFSQITDTRIIERARELKNDLGEEFFHPDVLTAIVNYNLVFGKKFDQLVHETEDKIKHFLKDQPETTPEKTREQLEEDYRTTNEAFQQLSKLGKLSAEKQREEEKQQDPFAAQQPGENQEPARPAAAPLTMEEELIGMGIDPGRQNEQALKRMREVALRIKANPRLSLIGSTVHPFQLDEWEKNALIAEFPATEESFRASFARVIAKCIGLALRIDEELPLYFETERHETSWKQHHDALIYLAYEGRRLSGVIANLTEDAQKKGLHEKVRQIKTTSLKLESAMRKLSSVFNETK